MIPTRPVLSERFSILETVLAKDQPPYQPLPVLLHPSGNLVMARWTFTEEERAHIIMGADLICTTLTFGQRYQPFRLEVLNCPRGVDEIAKWAKLTVNTYG